MSDAEVDALAARAIEGGAVDEAVLMYQHSPATSHEERLAFAKISARLTELLGEPVAFRRNFEWIRSHPLAWGALLARRP